MASHILGSMSRKEMMSSESFPAGTWGQFDLSNHSS